ncbi:hypothetical protein ORD22_14165 [Sporosarcina sp. GW1-11]|uniref:hypothetical protein n=1 Tax=Sporosarcina sp. GW1-11 TaxID=2899126 RepID=UPI00294D2299|nr:hypothetical protein [Sporosarcina sp. GW1-11]MDV6379359.1 hypothetical protein [Sporosarcina sp. GW1-11]
MKRVLWIPIIMILATALGVYGQDIAYYMTEHAVDINPVYYLTTCTVLSMLLYVVGYDLTIRLLKNRQISRGKVASIFLAFSIVAVPISMFSFLATVMWWG